MNKTCATCRFFLPATKIPGSMGEEDTCRRYPEYITRTMNDWCGEWSPRTDKDSISIAEYIERIKAQPLPPIPEEAEQKQILEELNEDEWLGLKWKDLELNDILEKAIRLGNVRVRSVGQ